MSHDARPRQPLCTQIDVGANTPALPPRAYEVEMVRLMRDLVTAQDRQNELLEELVNHLHATQRQKASELGQWKAANPQLARSCRRAAEALGRVQTEFLAGMTREITENYDNLLDGEFLLNEFVDRYGPRFAHLNGLVHVLAQLSGTPNQAKAPSAS